jgi:pyruvate dehydrogenase E2 component (dihydrolipoamide acetyltransferase)
MIEFEMPSLGADMEDGTLVEWRKKPGDEVKRGDIIADVDTQKGLIEIEVFDEGFIEKLLIEEGAKIPVGTPMALIKSIGENGEESRKEKPKEKEPEVQPTEVKKVAETIQKPQAKMPESYPGKRIKVSPLAKRIAAANNIDLSQVTGTGPGGAITKEDVENAITPEKGMVKEKSREKKTGKPAISAIRSAVAAAMSKSNAEIPHYYLEKRIDMLKAMAWISEMNNQRPVSKRLLPVALLIEAVAKALKDFPDLNAVWENGLQLKNEINIGFVVALRDGGIVVPAIHRADLKSIDEIMAMLNEIIPRAKALKLRSSELSDSTITITNLGENTADKVYGIIYPPQVAIIGFGNITEQPFAENGMLGIRPVLNVTLAGDHRATDGLTGSRFLSSLNKLLQNPEAL